MKWLQKIAMWFKSRKKLLEEYDELEARYMDLANECAQVYSKCDREIENFRKRAAAVVFKEVGDQLRTVVHALDTRAKRYKLPRPTFDEAIAQTLELCDREYGEYVKANKLFLGENKNEST